MVKQDDEGEMLIVVNGGRGGAAQSPPGENARLCWTTSRRRGAPAFLPCLGVRSLPRRLPRGLVLPSVSASSSSASSRPRPRPRPPRRGFVCPRCTSRVPVPVGASSALRLVVLLYRVPSLLARLRGGVRRCDRRRCGSRPRGTECLACGSGRSCGRAVAVSVTPRLKASRSGCSTHFSFSGS